MAGVHASRMSGGNTSSSHGPWAGEPGTRVRFVQDSGWAWCRGLPFALPLTITAGSAPWWQGADPAVSSLQITSVVAAHAHQVAGHDPAVAAHPWLERATRYCLSAIEAIDRPPAAYVLAFAVGFLDAACETRPETAELLQRLGKHVPSDGQVRVEGGTEQEMLHPLDFAPYPGRPAGSCSRGR
jgi:hypothetical protein